MIVKITNKSKNQLPNYETKQSAGMDLRASFQLTAGKNVKLFNAFFSGNKLTIRPGGRALIPTDQYIELPEGYEAQIRPRSGLALKHGITVLNSPGTIDADYRGNIGIILINHGTENFEIQEGDRIAQMVIAKHEYVKWEVVESLTNTERGEGGFGHTGVSDDADLAIDAEILPENTPVGEGPADCGCKKEKKKRK